MKKTLYHGPSSLDFWKTLYNHPVEDVVASGLNTQETSMLDDPSRVPQILLRMRRQSYSDDEENLANSDGFEGSGLEPASNKSWF